MKGLFSILSLQFVILTLVAGNVLAFPSDGISDGDMDSHVQAWRRHHSRRQADIAWMACNRIHIPFCGENADAYCCNWQMTCGGAQCQLNVCDNYPEYRQCTQNMLDELQRTVDSDYCQEHNNPCESNM